MQIVWQSVFGGQQNRKGLAAVPAEMVAIKWQIICAYSFAAQHTFDPLSCDIQSNEIVTCPPIPHCPPSVAWFCCDS